MKGTLTIAVAALAAGLAVAPTAVAQGTGVKVGVIDVQRIVGESAVGKESLARVQKVQQSKQEELVKRQKELRDLEQKISEQNKALSEEALEKVQKDYQGKALDLKRFQDDAQRELEETQRRELGELEKRIMPVIDAVAKEKNLQMVFSVADAGVVWAYPGLDVTSDVIKRFDQMVSAGAAAPKQ